VASDPTTDSTRFEAIRLVLYEPANPGSVLELKEVLPAARALGLTVRSWEVRGADGFEKVFAAMSKERPDGLFVLSGPLMDGY
jgi:ABC-type uncharacterized transport system substrate-binding protein